jgi:hypothetical protein
MKEAKSSSKQELDTSATKKNEQRERLRGSFYTFNAG